MAVDDDQPALDILKKYIAFIPMLQLAYSFSNGIEALPILQEENIDLLFVNIAMHQFSGIDLVKSTNNPPKIIFTTTHRRHAMEAFDLNAIDCLLKPISFERFVRAVNKVIHATMEENVYKDINGHTPEIGSNYIYFRSDRKVLKILIDDILYIESLKDYVKVVTKNKTIITRQSISALESALPKDLFIRIHRSFIVAFKNIDCFTSERIEIAKYELPISRLYRHEVEHRLHQ